MYNEKLAFYTRRLIKRLPYWFKIKKDCKNSIGRNFLNVFGMELDEVKFLIDYGISQTKIDSVDLNYCDICYYTVLDFDEKIENIKISSVFYDGGLLTETDNIGEFYSVDVNSIMYSAIHTKQYLYDRFRRVIYTRFPYNKDDYYKYGYIKIKLNDNSIKEYELKPHHVWNFLDEFGLLLSCPRLFLESNKEYKRRILDVFKNPANSSKTGLLNGIARELDLRKSIIWENGEENLIIKDLMVTLNKIKVDDKFVNIKDVYLDQDDNIILLGNKEYKNIKREVSYVHGIEMHVLNNEKDIQLRNELYNTDGTANENLTYYINKIKDIAPISWDMFKWGEVYWDAKSIYMSGISHIPCLLDGKIEGFKNGSL